MKFMLVLTRRHGCAYVCPPLGARVRVSRVISNVSSFSNRNTITPTPKSENSDLGEVINESKKSEMYDLKGGTYNSPSENCDVRNDKPDTYVISMYRTRPGHN